VSKGDSLPTQGKGRDKSEQQEKVCKQRGTHFLKSADIEGISGQDSRIKWRSKGHPQTVEHRGRDKLRTAKESMQA